MNPFGNLIFALLWEAAVVGIFSWNLRRILIERKQDQFLWVFLKMSKSERRGAYNIMLFWRWMTVVLTGFMSLAGIALIFDAIRRLSVG